MPRVSVSSLVADKAYVPGLSRDYVARHYGISVEHIAKLGSAENPHGASPKAMAAVRDALGRLDIYPDWTAGPLREAIAAKYGFDPDCVVCGSGETEVISMIISAFAGPGDAVLMCDPCFPIYHLYANCEGRNAVFVKTGEDFEPPVDRYIEALAYKPSIAFVTNPHNPSGHLLDENEIRRICEAADEETLVVLDEAYIHYAETPGCMHLLDKYRNLIVLRTFSKAFGLAGLRVGFGVSANRDNILPLWNVKPTWNMGQAPIAGGIAALDDNEHVDQAVQTVTEMRAYVGDGVAALNAFRIVPGAMSNFFLLQVLAPELNSTMVFESLLQRGVIVKDGRDIQGVGDRHLRVDVNLKKHMDRLLWALGEIESGKAA